jgi:hypothetical protein
MSDALAQLWDNRVRTCTLPVEAHTGTCTVTLHESIIPLIRSIQERIKNVTNLNRLHSVFAISWYLPI